MSSENRISLIFLAAIALGFVQTSSASAATCTINGTLRYEPRDYYYCDTDVVGADCSNWLAVNLDRRRVALLGAEPMQHMKIEVRATENGVPLTTVYTNTSGRFTATITRPSCTNTTVYVAPTYWRRNESIAAQHRFRITDAMDRDVSVALPAALTGATSTWAYTLSGTSTTQNARRFATYYTMNSALTEVVTWSANLSARLSGTTVADIQPVVMDSTYNGGSKAETAPGKIGRLWLDYDDYASGQTIRHELGHWVHQVAHKELQKHDCLDYRFPGNLPQEHNTDSCEYGFSGVMEGIATFIAARSVTENDKFVWSCWIQSGNQDECTKQVVARTGDSDNNDGVVSGAYEVLGDWYVDRASRCVVPATGCGCANPVACNNQDVKNDKGWRIETQVARFFWDILDTNNESNLDDTDRSMEQFIASLEGMSCTGSADGSCNEPNPGACTAASRDKYNSYDFGDLIPGDQAAERTLNCVADSEALD